MAVSANRLELLQIADAVAREKSIDRGIVITAMEDAIAKAARSRYGAETDVHAEIEPKTGDLRLTRHMLVVENVENPSNQITLEEARKRDAVAYDRLIVATGCTPRTLPGSEGLAGVHTLRTLDDARRGRSSRRHDRGLLHCLRRGSRAQRRRPRVQPPDDESGRGRPGRGGRWPRCRAGPSGWPC